MTLGGPADILITSFLAIRRFGLRRTVYASILLSPVYVYSLPPVPCSCMRPLIRRCAPYLPYRAAVRSDLENLASQQEIYFSDHFSYTTDLEALGLVPASGVRIELAATRDGWSARATHDAVGEDQACALFWGNASPAEVGLDEGATAGEIICMD